ncbi:MAG: phospho-sugar mutase [Myxococcota bacterium]|nr:phospho-sugar mutase [Myxococcota bacterium]
MDRLVVEAWIARDPDEQTRAELQQLLEAGNDAELEDRFAGRLEFGTAGLRGMLGAGPMRMNRLVVRQTASGLASHLLSTVPDASSRGVVVGCDARRLSAEFALDTALVLAARGIAVHLFEGIVPTPVVAFAVRHHGAAAGAMVTASHNPPEYNGFKVYGESGAQIIPPQDQAIATAIDEASKTDIPLASVEHAQSQGLLRCLGKETVEIYLEGVARLSLHQRTTTREQLVLAYTPLHGVGAQTALEILERAGFSQVHVVESQRQPNGSFPTVRFPNPEEKGAMDAVLALAARVGADLACANDPDADRLAAAVRTPCGHYRMLSGDELGVLLGWDRLAHGPVGTVVGSTIVSSSLLHRIAASFGAPSYETLTGFKWLASQAMMRDAGGAVPVFAYEEALGYGLMHFVRDKDGLSALVSLCELAAALKDTSQTLLGQLEALYREHGLVLTGQRTIALSPGSPSLGQLLRDALPTTVGGLRVVEIIDLIDGSLSLPPSDVLVFHLQGGFRAIVRPSGTEPKVKCYYEIEDTVAQDETLEQAEARARQTLANLADAHLSELRALV